MKFWTYSLSAGQSLTITAGMGLTQLSIKMSSGASDAGTVEGNFTVNADDGTDYPSAAIALGSGGTVTVPAPPNSPIDGLTINCTTGTITLIGS